jgi:hypothetical protein
VSNRERNGHSIKVTSCGRIAALGFYQDVFALVPWGDVVPWLSPYVIEQIKKTWAPLLKRDPLGRSPLSGAVMASLERKEEPYG